MNTHWEPTTLVHNTDTGQTVTADVTQFTPEQRLTVNLQGIDINLQYNTQHQEYQGSRAGREFVSQGPRYYTVKQGRAR